MDVFRSFVGCGSLPVRVVCEGLGWGSPTNNVMMPYFQAFVVCDYHHSRHLF